MGEEPKKEGDRPLYPPEEEQQQLLGLVQDFCRIYSEMKQPDDAKVGIDAAIKVYLGTWDLRELPDNLAQRIDAERQKLTLLASSVAPESEGRRLKKEQNRKQFIRLWMEAKASPMYDKKAWVNVELQLSSVGAI